MFMNCLPIPLTDAEYDAFKAEAISAYEKVLPGKELGTCDLVGYDRDAKGFLFEMYSADKNYWCDHIVQVSDSDPILKRPYSVLYDHLEYETKNIPFAGLFTLDPDYVRYMVDELLS